MSSTDSPLTAQAAMLRQAMEHHQAGRLREAEQVYRQALTLDPGHPETLALMGILAGQGGNLPAAVELFLRALKRDPRNAQIHHNLGETYRHLGDFAKAKMALHRAIEFDPDHYIAYQSLTDLLLAEAARHEKAGDTQGAQELRLAAAAPLIEAGRRLAEKDFLNDAAEKLRAAAALAPDNPAVWCGLGYALAQLPSEAEPALRRAIALDPKNPWAYGHLGNALVALDRVAEAETAFRQGLERAPDDVACRQGLIWIDLIMPLYRPEADPAQIVATHRAWGDAATARVADEPARAFANARDPEKRLKLGYVSPDLKRHSVPFFLEPVLAAHDQAGFETFCYAEVEPQREDKVTARLKNLAGHWRPTVGLTDEALRRQIRRDGIDILIDLAGHFMRNRLSAFTVKPAPVTASWLGYPATTGLPSMDWRITDAIADPPGAERFYSERLMRLDGGFLCYRPPDESPAVAPPPVLTRPGATFGSFNNHLKINRAVAACWARILGSVPGARLLLKSEMMGDQGVRQLLLDWFAADGIGADRIELRPWTSGTGDHLAAYAEIDIALDPFPYNGTTTTCEALWMGVPVVSLIGDRHSGRVGLDLLTRVGLERLAAPDLDGYVRLAVALAGDPGELGRLRGDMRTRLRAAPLCDAPHFAHEFDAALRRMWRQWCESA
jgi:predicted O-linked N-acetylglucosamine transferase (SPINDLY family)